MRPEANFDGITTTTGTICVVRDGSMPKPTEKYGRSVDSVMGGWLVTRYSI